MKTVIISFHYSYSILKIPVIFRKANLKNYWKKKKKKKP